MEQHSTHSRESVSYIPKPSDDDQFVTIWSRQSDKQRLLQIVNNNQLRDCPNAQKKIEQKIDELVKNNSKDTEIYKELHDLVHKDIVNTEEYKRKHKEFVNNDRRSSSRTYQITNILKQLPTWWKSESKKMLDVGCSEGAITAALGQELGIPAEHIHGCDVRPVTATEGFQFQILEDAHKLPWGDADFTIVTALMSLHHVEIPTKMLEEIHRVLHPEGIFLIREHNCQPPELSVVFDLMHGFYAMVWAEPTEMDDFKKHFADYHTREYWKQKLENAGFEELPVHQKKWYARGNEFANPMEHYFAVFKKKENKKLQVQNDRPPQDNRQHYDNRNNRNYNTNNNYNRYNSNNNYDNRQSQNYHKRPYEDNRNDRRDDRRDHKQHYNRDDRRDEHREDRRDERRENKRIADSSGIDNSTEIMEKRRKKFEPNNDNNKPGNNVH